MAGLFDDLIPANQGVSFDDLIPRKPTPPPTPAPPSQMPGAGTALVQGIMSGGSGVKETLGGGASTGNPSPAAAGLEWSDITSPIGKLLPKIAYRLGESSPTLAGGLAGAGIGAVVPGGGETGLTELGGGTIGAVAGNFLQTYGPTIREELARTPGDRDGAFERAWKRIGIDAGATAAGWAAFGAINPFKSTIKNMALQALGVQPGISVASKTLENISEGRPASEGLGQAYAEGAVGTAIPALGLGAAGVAFRRARGTFGGAGAAPEATPETGGPAPNAPEAGSVVGLSINGEPRRATVGEYYDNGRAVRVNFDDGTTGDFHTSELLSGLTTPPEPGSEPPTLRHEPLSQAESEALMFGGDDYLTPRPSQRQTTSTLGRQALFALDQANGLRKTALDETVNLTTIQRTDMLREASRLEREYGLNPEEPSPEPYQRAGQPNVLGRFPDQGGLPYERQPWQAERPPYGSAKLGPLYGYERPEGEPYQPQPQEPDYLSARDDVTMARSTFRPPPSLFDAIRALGGIRPTPDVVEALRDYKNPPFKKRILNPNGVPPDTLRQLLQERGWFGDYEQLGSVTPGMKPGDDLNHLYDLLEQEAQGEPVTHPDDARSGVYQRWRSLHEEMDRAGVYNTDPPDIAARKLQAFRRSWAEEDERRQAEMAGNEPEGGYEPGADIGEEYGYEPTEEGLQQGMLPGTEPSQRQAIAARQFEGRGAIIPEKPQRPANEGLFAEKETPQEDLFDPKVESPADWEYSEPSAERRSQDLHEDFTDFVNNVLTERTPLGIQHAAAQYLLGRGRATGTEAVVQYDGRTGDVSHVFSDNNPVAVKITPGALSQMLDPSGQVVAHHNHPSGRSLSAGDISLLGYPGLKWITAVGHGGDYFAARLSDAERSIMAEDIARDGINVAAKNEVATLKGAHEEARQYVRAKFVELMASGKMLTHEANDLFHDAVNRVLAHRGIIDYMTSKELTPEQQNVVQELADADPETSNPYRHSEPVRFTEGMARVLGSLEGSPGQAGGPEGAAGSASGTFQGEVREPEEPPPFEPDGPAKSLPEGKDYIDNTAEQIAATLRGQPPGTYARTLRQLQPPSGPNVYKNIGNIADFTTRPRALASMDTYSGAFYNAWKAREREATRQLDLSRSDISPSFLKLSKAGRRNVYAIEELDRMTGTVRPKTGYSIVARNDGTENLHFSKPGDVIRLNPAETVAYFDRRNMFTNIWSRMMGATAYRLGWRGAWDHADIDGNLKAIEDATRTATTPRERKDAQNVLDIMKAMDEQRRQAYVPFMRYGDYFMSVTPKTGTEEASLGGHPQPTWFQTVERPDWHDLAGGTTIGTAIPKYIKPHLDALRQKFPEDQYNIEHGWLFSKPEALRQLDVPAIEKLLMLTEGGILNRLRDEEMMGGAANKAQARERARARYEDLYASMLEELRTQMYENLKAGFKRQSRNVPGYSSDWDRVTGSYMNWTASHIADQLHRDNIEDAYNTLQQTHPYKNTREYWQNWRNYMEKPTNLLSRISNGASNVGFMYTLAGNPSSSAVIGLHAPEMALPNLSVGVGMGKAASTFASAARHILGAIRADTTSGLHVDVSRIGKTPDEKAAIQRAAQEGLLKSVATEEMADLGRRQSMLWGEMQPTMRKAYNIATSNISVADQVNRASTFLTAYRMAKDPATLAKMDAAWSGNQIWRDMKTSSGGVTPEKMARFMLAEGAGDFGKANRAPMMRGVLGQAAFLLHGFQTQFLSTMFKLMTRMGPSGRIAFAWMLGALWTGAGVQGLPFAQDAENAADAIWKGFTGKDPMIAYRMQSALANSFGKVGAEMVMRGPLSTLSGVDIGSRIGFGDLLTREFSADTVFATLPSIILSRLAAAGRRAAHGDYRQAVEELLPAGVRHPVQAAEEAAGGVKTTTGKTLIPAHKVTPGMTIERGFGFTPEEIERIYEKMDYEYRAGHARMRPPPNPIP